MTLPIVSPAPRAAWEALLASDPSAVVGQSLPWRDAVLADGRFADASLLYTFASGREVLVPLARRRRLPAAVESWPQVWGTGGPISTGGRVDDEEAAAVLRDLARRAPTVAITLHWSADPAWPAAARSRPWQADAGTAYVVDLAGGFDAVWSRYRGTARTAVRKAEKAGVEVEVDRTGALLPVHDDLQERAVRRRAAVEGEPLWLARWRMGRVSSAPAQVALVAARFGKACATWVARHAGEPVAAIVVLEAGDQAKYWRGAMDRNRANPVRANDLLHRLAMEDACARGLARYDMGAAQPGSPLAVFKTKLGAQEHPTYELRARRPIGRMGQRARLRAEHVVKHVAGIRDM